MKTRAKAYPDVPPIQPSQTVAKKDNKSSSCSLTTKVALSALALVSPFAVGAPLWIMGEKNSDSGLELAGRVIVYGAAALEGACACIALLFISLLSPGNGRSGVGD
jgi:hypothetical protein